MKTIAPADSQPAALGKTPRIKTRAHLAQALALLSWMDSRRKTVEAARDQTIDLARATAAQQLQIDVNGTLVPFEAYAQAINDAAAEFVAANREELFSGGKTLKLPVGEVSIRALPAKLEIDDRAGVVQKFIDQHALLKKGLELLKRLKCLPYLKVKFELDADAVKRAAAAGTVPAEELEALGMRLVTGQESVALKPYDYSSTADVAA